MALHRSIWSVFGDGCMIERKLFVWFYRRRLSQKWSPLMHEIATEYGIRVGALRIGWSWTAKHFYDGKEPAVVAGPY